MIWYHCLAKSGWCLVIEAKGRMPKVSFGPKLQDFTSLSFDMIYIYVILFKPSLTCTCANPWICEKSNLIYRNICHFANTNIVRLPKSYKNWQILAMQNCQCTNIKTLRSLIRRPSGLLTSSFAPFGRSCHVTPLMGEHLMRTPAH